MKSYLVGGAVRDRLLGLNAIEQDWLVTGATEAMMLEQGFTRFNSDFPVFLHPKTGDEYALARREFKTGAGYKGFTTQATPDVTLEEDLSRRDLTINAIAEDADGQLTDPYNGQQDLTQRTLRHITPAFVEDPVRVLRAARFAAYLGHYNFQIAPETNLLMQQMSSDEDFNHLKRERVWREIKRALDTPAPWRFIEVLHQCQALKQLMPLLDAHYKAAISTLKSASKLTDDPVDRFTALFYWSVVSENVDIKLCCQSLRAEKPYSDQLQLVVKCAPLLQNIGKSDAEQVLDFFEQSRALKDPKILIKLHQLTPILWPEQIKLLDWLVDLLPAIAAISTKSLQADGLQGRALGEALHKARQQAIIEFKSLVN